MATRNLGPESEGDGGIDMMFQWSEGNQKIVSDLRKDWVSLCPIEARVIYVTLITLLGASDYDDAMVTQPVRGNTDRY